MWNVSSYYLRRRRYYQTLFFSIQFNRLWWHRIWKLSLVSRSVKTQTRVPIFKNVVTQTRSPSIFLVSHILTNVVFSNKFLTFLFHSLTQLKRLFIRAQDAWIIEKTKIVEIILLQWSLMKKSEFYWEK